MSSQQKVEFEQPVVPTLVTRKPAQTLQLERQQQADNRAKQQGQAGVEKKTEKAEGFPQRGQQQTCLFHAYYLVRP
ncbi:hypothetical protein ACSVIJ_09250 [Pseudomonas sp. NCHU5208]|uniref:hypothetical protein n=1 Tax=unclassified Pseudomonas TaxID=196821 RepID=UPI003F984A4E